tara:strand:+ start:382 stop:1164 length:783 start_codon:yes stop_codon:yes gene_type:complete
VQDWLIVTKFLPQLIYPFSIILWILLAILFCVYRGYRKTALTLVVIVVFLLIFFGSPFSSILLQSHENIHKPVSISQTPVGEAIVVLGGDVGLPVKPRLNSQLHGNRLLHAFRLYKLGKAPLVVVSGGNVYPQNSLNNESEYAAKILESWGIPAAAIMTEIRSRNTFENAFYTQEILSSLGIDRILLVTAAAHMPRAFLVFTEMGFDVIPSSSEFAVTDYQRPKVLNWVPSLGNIGRAQKLVHEKIGIFYYRIRGWIDYK